VLRVSACTVAGFVCALVTRAIIAGRKNMGILWCHTNAEYVVAEQWGKIMPSLSAGIGNGAVAGIEGLTVTDSNLVQENDHAR